MAHEAEAAPTIKRMRLRYAGNCADCGTTIEAGVTADYDKASRTVHCVECPSQQGSDMPLSEAQATVLKQAPATSTQQPSGARPELAIVEGVAGASAAREFERRHDARRERVVTAHPKVGKFLLAVFDDPQSTRAWSTGAIGEEALGGMLASMAGPALRVLHDRRIPRTRANIDHLVVCPTGVFVIDAKRYRGARPQRRVFGGLFTPRTETLYVGGRDRTKLVDGMTKQLELVKTALADDPDVPVKGVLCFIDADWPAFGGSFTIRDVAVVWPKKLKAMLNQPGPLDQDRIAELQWRLHEAFPRQN